MAPGVIGGEMMTGCGITDRSGTKLNRGGEANQETGARSRVPIPWNMRGKDGTTLQSLKFISIYFCREEKNTVTESQLLFERPEWPDV